MGRLSDIASEYIARCPVLDLRRLLLGLQQSCLAITCWHQQLLLSSQRSAGSSKSSRIGVIRDAFTPFNAREYPLHSTIASLGEGQAAVHSAAAFNPQGIVVDEYVQDKANGVYRLTNVATDLLRCVTHVC